MSLSDDIMREICQHGWTGWLDAKCPPSVYVIEEYPRIKTPEDLPKNKEWRRQRSILFRFQSLKKVRALRDEFAEMHVRNDRLDDVLQREEMLGPDGNVFKNVDIDVRDIQQTAVSLREMASQAARAN